MLPITPATASQFAWMVLNTEAILEPTDSAAFARPENAELAEDRTAENADFTEAETAENVLAVFLSSALSIIFTSGIIDFGFWTSS